MARRRYDDEDDEGGSGASWLTWLAALAAAGGIGAAVYAYREEIKSAVDVASDVVGIKSALAKWFGEDDKPGPVTEADVRKQVEQSQGGTEAEVQDRVFKKAQEAVRKQGYAAVMRTLYRTDEAARAAEAQWAQGFVMVQKSSGLGQAAGEPYRVAVADLVKSTEFNGLLRAAVAAYQKGERMPKGEA